MKKKTVLPFLLSLLLIGCSNIVLGTKGGDPANSNSNVQELPNSYNPGAVNIRLNSNMVSGSFFYLASAMLACTAYEYWGEDNRRDVEGLNGRFAVIRPNAYNIKSRIKSVISGMGAVLAFYVGSKFFLNY